MSESARILLQGVGVDFPVFNAASLSLKNRVLSAMTGGRIDRQHDGAIVVRGLADINLEIRAGERVGLVGHNGSGKTTLLRVLSGIYFPTQGNVDIRGDCVSLINISLGIDPEATGRENIRLRGAMMGMTPAEVSARLDEIIEFSGLGDFIEMPFRTYSSGMQLRLAFAVSTSIRPQILVMDEWLSTGDEDFRERAEKRMNEVVHATEILVLASHTRELIESTCNRVIWLEHGHIRMDGPVNEVVAAYFG
jgi:lipopolysaccharide transport system ATP-binding protein